MKVLFAIVNYKTDKMLLDYLRSIAKAAQSVDGIKLDALIIDNSMRSIADRPDFTNSLRSCFSDLDVVFPEKNLGYFGGLPIAQERAKKNNSDVVIFSNADLLLASDFFANLNRESGGTAAVLAPSILSDHGDGFDQNPKHLTRISLQKLKFLKAIYSNPVSFAMYIWLGKLKESMKGAVSWGKEASAVSLEGDAIYASHGAIFVFCDANFFQSLPKHEPFLYGEELMVAEEAVLQGRTIRYAPKLKVFDLRHGSTGELHSDYKRRLLHASMIFVLKRYHRVFPIHK